MQSETSPSISIVIPTYCRRQLVCDTVANLDALAEPGPCEIIVVVDGSNDGTAQALHKVSCRYPVHVIEQDNRGAAAARNEGARHARGDAILFMDDDMICDPGAMEHLRTTLSKGADAVIGQLVADDEMPDNFLTRQIRDRLALAAQATPDDETVRDPFDVVTMDLLVRREVFEKLGGFDESFTRGGMFSCEDVDFAIRLIDDYDLRRNQHALFGIRYHVSPQQLMKRASMTGRADRRFSRIHPRYADRLLAATSRQERMHRLLYRPLGHLPVLPALMGKLAVLSTMIDRQGRSPAQIVPRLYSAAWKVNYWSGFLRSAEAGRAKGIAK